MPNIVRLHRVLAMKREKVYRHMGPSLNQCVYIPKPPRQDR